MPEPRKRRPLISRACDQEAIRVIVISCLDMLKPLRERLPDSVPPEVDPDNSRERWLRAAEDNLTLLLRLMCENEV